MPNTIKVGRSGKWSKPFKDGCRRNRGWPTRAPLAVSSTDGRARRQGRGQSFARCFIMSRLSGRATPATPPGAAAQGTPSIMTRVFGGE
jgi:hypothetical protein